MRHECKRSALGICPPATTHNIERSCNCLSSSPRPPFVPLHPCARPPFVLLRPPHRPLFVPLRPCISADLVLLHPSPRLIFVSLCRFILNTMFLLAQSLCNGVIFPAAMSAKMRFLMNCAVGLDSYSKRVLGVMSVCAMCSMKRHVRTPQSVALP